MSFSHLDPGTDESVWQAALARRDLPVTPMTMDALVVVSAHPDDEALGVGGMLHHAARRSIPIVLIVVTNGEHSHPRSSTVPTAELGDRRRRELREAMGVIAPDADVRFLGVADGEVREHSRTVFRALRDALGSVAARAERPLVVGPWQGDRHRDHRVAGELAERVSAELGLAYLAYPIWLWHWGAPTDVPWDRASIVPLDVDDRDAKRAAIAAHVTQTQPLSEQIGDEVMLHERMLSHFDRPVEVLFAEGEQAHEGPDGTIDVDWFDSFYARNDDPWGFDSRWYEARKRAVVLASLPDREYSRALELGCATGALTEMLAERCEQVVAVDAVQTALDRARARLGDRDDVELRRLVLPDEWPEGEFDLVVFAELGYYWDAPDLVHAIERMLRSLAPGGHLVACHWRHPVAANPVTGDGVHVALRTMRELVTVVRHEEEDFLLDVFARPPARSVARREGLVP